MKITVIQDTSETVCVSISTNKTTYDVYLTKKEADTLRFELESVLHDMWVEEYGLD